MDVSSLQERPHGCNARWSTPPEGGRGVVVSPVSLSCGDGTGEIMVSVEVNLRPDEAWGMAGPSGPGAGHMAPKARLSYNADAPHPKEGGATLIPVRFAPRAFKLVAIWTFGVGGSRALFQRFPIPI